MRRLMVVLVLAVTAAGALCAGEAHAAACPNAPPGIMPVDEVATASSGAGRLAASGETVSRGVDPEPFTVTVLGVLENGIAPGVPMIIVETESTAIDDAGGIWAGMSGSPVYDVATERLIGAVAYGLSGGPSKIGGVTPAAHMTELLALPQQQTVQLSSALRQEVAATGSATARLAARGLTQLPIPLGVPGLRPGRLDKFAAALGVGERFIPYSAAAPSDEEGDRDEIKPGGNFAAALSYGDVTAAGVGTTTAVCDDSALAFGHPMVFDGRTSLSVHNATAITVQDDPTFVPFKLANIGGWVGTLDQDRLAGIRGLLGARPTPIEVRSSVTETGDPLPGLTRVNRTADVPGIAFGHLIASIDRAIDRIGSGRSSVGWTVSGIARGEFFSLSRNNRFADNADISIASSIELVEQLGSLVDNPFADVTVTGLDIKADLDPAFQRYRITGLERHNGSGWVRVDPASLLVVAPGSTLQLRVLLAAHRSDAAIPPVELSYAIPQNAAGGEASLDIAGGSAPAEEGALGEFAPFGGGPSAAAEPASFAELLASLENAKRGDDVVAELRFFGGGPAGPPPPVATLRRRVAEVVTGNLSIPVMVEGGEPPFEPPFEEPPFEEEGIRRARLSVGGQSTQSLEAALRRGVRLTVRTNARGRLALRAQVSRKAARRLDLAKRVVAAKTRRVRAGRTVVTLKLRRGARTKLQDASGVRLAIRARITTAGGTRTDRFAVALKRREG